MNNLATSNPRQLEIADGELWFWDSILDDPDHRIFALLQSTVEWQQHQVYVFGQTWPAPRLSAWYGDPIARYQYSGLKLEPRPWMSALTQLRDLVESRTGCHFNSVLLNRYRDGRDGMGWHSDDEPELGGRPQIAALSLGVSRRFLMRRRDRRDERLELSLGNTSLLLMNAPTQQFWQHSLPKTRRPTGERISLTFRLVEASCSS